MILRFFVAEQHAGASAEVGLVNVIWEASERGDWRAASHLLSRRYPDRWGPNAVPQVEPLPAATPSTVLTALAKFSEVVEEKR